MELFKLTKKIDVIVEDPETGHRLTYSSRIEDIGEDSMTIAAPYRRGSFLPPWTGRTFSGRIAGDKCAYIFKSALLQYITDPIPLWVIAPPTDVKKVQMRSYVRLDIVLDVKLEFPGEGDGGDGGGSRVISTLTRDISAGGIRVVVSKPLVLGKKVKIILPLPEADTVEAVGEVLRNIPPENPGERHTAAIEFIDIKEKNRGKIVKYIFRKQIERRKKERELFQEET